MAGSLRKNFETVTDVNLNKVQNSVSSLAERFREENPLARWGQHPILLAVSGGADSTALLNLFCTFREEFRLKIYAAHANHQLRGKEADGDEAFVKELCEKRDVPCVSERLEISRSADGLENDARRARYAFLERTAETLGARYIALAHHRNDQAETILHRILRGTGVAGLAGMARMRPLNPAVTLLRPLLSFSREEITEYLESQHMTWRTDSSNKCTDYTRNRIREKLLPELRQDFNPQIDAALVRLGILAGEMQSFTDAQTQILAEKIVRENSGGIQILRPQKIPGHSPTESVSPFLLTELFRSLWRQNDFSLQEMGLSEWTLLTSMLLARPDAPCAHIFPGNVRVRQNENGVFIQK